ncbi:CTTNBP2 N-terminal-like protein [Frankliniella fusca]|uniref:CTTNBP2 N-terminal-like protein n=1 Tax=Frankliniella fusca TaxID=407009 RepID=A0AAE1HGQ7_9NEOP|nr:CTTNBP2 N-terminal-like protein [Frankliniella fusca]
MASHPSANKLECQATSSKSPQHQKGTGSNFEPLDKATSNTLKRNPKMELSKQELLKLLSYLEGELEAREIVIAALKSEKVKQLVHQSRHRPGTITQSHLALQQDSFAVPDSRLGLDCLLADHQMASLDNVILQHKQSQLRMAKMLRDMELRHLKVVQELDEEKRKHEHDTAQGDDITYGLEKERTRLKQELELEKQTRKKQEKDLKRANEVLEEERNRQKQIVLLLLAERKKLIMKYVEERKRSEDLAQIVSEEKVQMNAMADGLEEESKKSLQMEAELEKQMAQFDLERQHLKQQLQREQRRISELEAELEKSKTDLLSANKQLAEAHQVAMFQASVNTQRPGVVGTVLHKPVPQPPGSSKGVPWSGLADGDAGAQTGSPMLSSVAKVVQPTATVSSVPVCAPTTGIARSVSPGQSARTALFSPNSATSPASQDGEQSNTVPNRPSHAPTSGTKLYATSAGGKLTFHVSAAAAAAAEAAAANESATSSGQPQPPPKKAALGRGVPPPVPPNKPVVPPKKDSVVGRKVDGGLEGATAGAKLGLVGKDKAPQVGREPSVGPTVCAVDSLHATATTAATAPAHQASSHTPSASSGESSGPIDVISAARVSNETSLSTPVVPAIYSSPPVSSPDPTTVLCSSPDQALVAAPALATTSTSNPIYSPTTPAAVSSAASPSTSTITPSASATLLPDLLPECVPNTMDPCNRSQMQPEVCITPKVK